MAGITWISVRERTREFGTRRALGARASDVLLHVVAENTVLVLGGCVVGVLLSWPISLLVSRAAGVNFLFNRDAALAAFGAAALLNFGFAMWPSRRGANLDPCEALRYE